MGSGFYMDLLELFGQPDPDIRDLLSPGGRLDFRENRSIQALPFFPAALLHQCRVGGFKFFALFLDRLVPGRLVSARRSRL